MLQFIHSFFAPNALVVFESILGLILADFVFGVLVSLRNGNFNFSNLPRFVETSLVPYVGGLLVLALFTKANAELGALFFTVAATITAKFLADIVSKASQLFNGLQIQSPITVAQPQYAPAQPEPAANIKPEVTQ